MIFILAKQNLIKKGDNLNKGCQLAGYPGRVRQQPYSDGGKNRYNLKLKISVISNKKRISESDLNE